MTTSLSTTPVLGSLQALVRDVAPLVDALDTTTWEAPSPCPELTAHQLVEHLVGGLDAFSRVADGTGTPDFSTSPVLPADASATYRAAAARAVRSWAAPGRLTAEFAMPWGLSSGAQLVGFLVIEQAVHGWDLARALGRTAVLDEPSVAVADTIAREMVTDAMRVPGMFGPEVVPPAGASRLDSLAAFLGRTV